MIDRRPNAMPNAARNAALPREPVRQPRLRCMPAHRAADAGARARAGAAAAIAKTAPGIDAAERACVIEWFRTVG
ncbi:hypothetical protein [Burkholderia singularis]|uniref:Uncharacterized protein n=1 Tax=Burkholderia singularis TaxID=1503053 RepID=A0A238HBV7_9BURK|nr:hypothetical protein [Burkholderia singularis]SMG02769.1 hypothetical protein BSIN_3467 [Burkholderia singularis]